MKDGVIADYDTTEVMLNYFIKKVNGKNELIYVDATKPYSTRYFMENDFSNDVFNKNATSENKNNFKSNSSNNFLSNILKDKENALIIILIIILLKNSSDKKMILALCYLLI